MLRPPPLSTLSSPLFPYTTPIRSQSGCLDDPTLPLPSASRWGCSVRPLSVETRHWNKAGCINPDVSIDSDDQRANNFSMCNLYTNKSTVQEIGRAQV